MGKSENTSYTDLEIIQAISSGGPAAQRVTNHLYAQFSGYVINGQKKYHISQQDALDAYSDAVMGLCGQIRQGKFRGESALSTYLFRSFQNRCVDRVRKLTSNKGKIEWADELPVLPDLAANMVKTIIDRDSVKMLSSFMDKIGERCRQMLMDAEYHGYGMDEIAKKHGLKGGPSASTLKHRCLQKLKKLIKQSRIDISPEDPA